MLNKLEKCLIETGKDIINYKKNNLINSKIIKDQIKTNIDIYANRILKLKLKKIKNIPIISEENKKNNFSNVNEYWLIDPIDGTKSLVNGYKGWVTQVAYVKNFKIKLSAVYAPELNELYSGSNYSKNIYFNKIKFSKKNKKKIYPLFIDNYPKPNNLYKKIFKKIQNYKYIECGSIGLKMCKVIFDEADCFIKNVVVRDWDVAPALLFASLRKIKVYDYKYNLYKISKNYEKQGLIILSKRYEKTIKNIQLK